MIKRILPAVICAVLLLSSCGARADGSSEEGDMRAETASPAVTEEESVTFAKTEAETDDDAPGDAEEPAQSDPPSAEGLVMTAEPDRLPVGSETVALKIYNPTSREIHFGISPMVQVWDGSDWSFADFGDGFSYVYDSIEYSCEPGESHEFTAQLHPDLYEYAPGRYRIMNEELYAEFELE